MRYVIYNPLSCNGIGIEMKNSFFKKYNFDIYKEINILEINLEEFISNLDINDELILIGGDGTLNVFVNEYKKANIHNKLFLYAGGSGNDFIKDIDKNLNELIEITKYAKNLPVVKVDNISKYFFNNVGFGIDGKVCYKAEELKKKKKKFNYTFIAAKLLLLYKKKNVVIEVDGKTYKYKHVILAATMNGRYYGGGMKNAPDQDRLSNELTIIVLHMRSNLHALIKFPKMIEGNHYQFKRIVAVHKGKNIKVTFDKPEYIQIDGEVLGKYLSYSVIK